MNWIQDQKAKKDGTLAAEQVQDLPHGMSVYCTADVGMP